MTSSRNVSLLLLGLLLIALSAAWFFTPLSETVLDAVRQPAPALPGGDIPKGIPAAETAWIDTVLNGLNTLFGAVGLYLTARNARSRS